MDDSTPALLKAEQLCKTYAQRPIVKDLSFHVMPGEVVGLLGPNGAGKTTAFYLTIGLIHADKGKVLFAGQDVTTFPVHQRARMGLGYLAQEPSIFRGLTVEENILCIVELAHPTWTKKMRKAKLEELLAELHLEHLAKKHAVTLSGGERRRLEITRALVTNPSLLLLDEPFANIDPLTIQDVKTMIRLLKSKGISVLITDHNAREIFSIVDRSYLMQQGTVLLCGTVDFLLSHPLARSCYLGEDFRV